MIAVQRPQRFALLEPRERLVGGVAIVLAKQRPGVDERGGQTGDALAASACQPAVRAAEAAGAHLLEASSSSASSASAPSSTSALGLLERGS